ncbi:unnamed protein product [Blepharisma stoltei]|uniref:Uncharacterized protein n=1 Tax=Blepharisma stoltei TaxID=1481888 RepID=A0AAU9KI23_9CILI|nr:unnamed protein product [Blepharisma stoltei]
MSAGAFISIFILIIITDLVMLLLFLLAFVESTLLSSVTVFRHGARSPVNRFSWDTGYWPRGLGELTLEGMIQEYNLGLKLKDRYLSSGCEFDINNISKEIYVRSSDSKRAIMSAQFFMMGFLSSESLYPEVLFESLAFPSKYVLGDEKFNLYVIELPNTHTKVKVYSIKKKLDHMLVGWSSKVCPRLKEIFYEVWQTEEYKQKVLEYNLGTKLEMRDSFDTDVSLEKSWEYADTIQCELFHGYELPKNTNYDLYWKIHGLHNYTNSYAFNKEGASLVSSKFFKELLEKFNWKINNDFREKFGFYFAHDATLVGFLKFLNIWDGNNPDFGAYITFELHQENNENYVKILYNDVHVKLQECKEDCLWEDFQKIVAEKLTLDLNKACSLKYDFNVEETSVFKSSDREID